MGNNLTAHDNLTKREIEIGRLMAQAYSIDEIADILSISPSTVSCHINKIYQKFHLNLNCHRSVIRLKAALIFIEKYTKV